MTYSPFPLSPERAAAARKLLDTGSAGPGADIYRAPLSCSEEILAAAARVPGLEGDPLGEFAKVLARVADRLEHLDTSEIANAAADGAWRSSYHVARVHARRLDRITLAIATLLLFGAFFLGVLVGNGRL